MPHRRIDVIDALRGFALAGVGVVHFLERFAGGLLAPGAAEAADTGYLDLAFRGLLWISFGKFFALFSLLFGVSFVLMRESATARGEDFTTRYLWRGAILLGIGILHQLFYRGDILIVYAVVSPALLLLYRLRNRWLLLLAAVCFLSVPRLLSFALAGGDPVAGGVSVLDAAHPYTHAYTRLLSEGSFARLAHVHLTSGLALKADLYLGALGRLYYTLGYFTLGLLLARAGVFRTGWPWPRPRLLRGALRLLGVGTLLMLALFSQVSWPVDWTRWLPVVALNFYDWTNLAAAALLLLWFLGRYRTGGGKVLAWFAPYGRMALTNYVGLSIVGTFLLFDWGLGLFDVLRTHQLALLAAVVIGAQMVFSAYWLARFRYGPLEWFWRSLTYLEPQRIRLPSLRSSAG